MGRDLFLRLRRFGEWPGLRYNWGNLFRFDQPRKLFQDFRLRGGAHRCAPYPMCGERCRIRIVHNRDNDAALPYRAIGALERVLTHRIQNNIDILSHVFELCLGVINRDIGTKLLKKFLIRLDAVAITLAPRAFAI
jgi:hypothetical protein